MSKIAIHQANFVPWIPFFYKMAMVDKFIILIHVDFEKNNFQNRFNYRGEWITKPISSGKTLIKNKTYADGQDLSELNMLWIQAMKRTLSIKTKLVYDYPTELKGTERLIDLIKHYEGTCYVTNPDAKDKYLDEDLMLDEGINIEYCKVPRNLKISFFEALDNFGLEGTIKQLPKCRA